MQETAARESNAPNSPNTDSLQSLHGTATPKTGDSGKLYRLLLLSLPRSFESDGCQQQTFTFRLTRSKSV
jgi:hypothetical protein